MENTAAKKKKRLSTSAMIMCALFTALIAVGAFIKIPVPVIPFTLQVLFALLAGLLLGSRLGAFSAFLYMILGLVGLPIFAEGGGPGYIFKPSFGYIIGFIVGTFVTGLIVEKARSLKFSTILAANFIGLFIIYGMGMVYYYLISNYVISTPIGLWPLFLYCFVLVIPGDTCLCIVAALLAKRLIPTIKKLNYRG